jgi:hypothetical protein
MTGRVNTAVAAAVLLVVVFITGCAEVAVWERGHLAKPHAAVDPFPQQSALRAHIYSSREAASGGQESAGGGCGCN